MNTYFKDKDFAKENFNYYNNFFEGFFKKDAAFSSEERSQINKMAGEYYSFLEKEGYSYGGLAFDMSQNTGFYGKVANSYLNSAMKAEHPEWSAAKRSDVRSSFISKLIYADSSARIDSIRDGQGGNINKDIVTEYHYAALKELELSRNAWGGSMFNEFSGEGDWEFIYKDNIDIQQQKIIEAIIKGKTINGVDARTCMSYMVDATYAESLDAYMGENNAIWNVYASIFNALKESIINIFSNEEVNDEHSSTLSWFNSLDLKLSVAIGLQILFDAQNVGYVVSMQNAERAANNFGRASNYPSSSPIKGTTRNSPASTPSRGGSSPNPTKGPTASPNKGPTGGGSATNRNNAPTVRPASTNPTANPAKAPTANGPTVRTQASTNNQPSKTSTSGASRNANAPTTGQRASSNGPSVSPTKTPVSPSSNPAKTPSSSSSGSRQSPTANSPKTSGSSATANNAPTIKVNPSGASSSKAPSASSARAPVIIPVPTQASAPTPIAPVRTYYQPPTIRDSQPTTNTRPTAPTPSITPNLSPTLNSQPSTPWSNPTTTASSKPTLTPSLNNQNDAPWRTPNAPWYSPSLTNTGRHPSLNPNINNPFVSPSRTGSPTVNNAPFRPTSNNPLNTPLNNPVSSPSLTPIHQPSLQNQNFPTPSRNPIKTPISRPVANPLKSGSSQYRSGPYGYNPNNYRFADPSWVYSRNSPNDHAAYRKFNNARSNFANSFDPSNRGNFGFNNFNEFQSYGKGTNGANTANARARASFAANWAGAVRGAVRYAASHVSPLVFDLGCDGVDLLSFNEGVYFDIDNDGFVEKIGWVKAEDGQLARDLNQNGKIDDITELFGDDITTAFYKLAMLDTNKDKVIDKNDKAFKELLVWQDINKNGYSEKDELKSLSELGITSISLDTVDEDQEIEGNLISESSTFTYADGRVCKVLDVHYHNNDMDSWYKGESKIEGNEAREKIKEEINEYIQYIFRQLKEEYTSVFGYENTEFRVSEIIRFKTEEYIEEVIINKIQKARKDEIDEDFKDGQEILENLFKVSNDKFYKDITNLIDKINKDNADKQQSAKDEATKKLQEDFIIKKDNIASRYIQRMNNEIEELNQSQLTEVEFKQTKESIEKKLQKEETNEVLALQKRFSSKYIKINDAAYYHNEKNSEKIKTLKETFSNKKEEILKKYNTENGTIFEEEVANAQEKLKDYIKKEKEKCGKNFGDKKINRGEYAVKIKELNDKLALGINKEKIKTKIENEKEKEIAKLNSLYQQKSKHALRKEVEEDINAKTKEEKHSTEQLAIEGMKAINKFYKNQKSKAKVDLNNHIKYLIESIKEEANQIYRHVLDEEQFTRTSKNKEAKLCLEESSFSFLGKFYNYFFTPELKEVLNNNWLNSSLYIENNAFQATDEGIIIDPETLLMPLMRGYGSTSSLHIAMSMNSALKLQVMDLIYIKAIDLYDIQSKITSILYSWAGVEKIEDNSRSGIGSPNIEARKIGCIEKITGQPFKQLGAANFVGQFASASMQKAWDIILIRATKNLLIQGPLMGIFPKAVYSFEHDSITLNNSLDEILNKAKKFADDNKLGYDFWVQIGYILASSAVELQIKISELKERLSILAGEPILVGLEPFSLVGNNDNNYIRGTSGSDYIKGLSGNDKIEGKEGSDFIEGGEGDDEINGGDGIDRLYGDGGSDRIYGGKDKDFIYGGSGGDYIYGEEGDDHIEGGEGADFMDGGAGKNTLSYGMSSGGVRVNLATKEASGFDAEGDSYKNFINLGGSEYDDYLVGDDQDNEINGEGGNDEIHGGKGDDHLFGARGIDKLLGEEGDDILTGFEGADHMDGGAGKDTADYSHPYAIVGVKVNLTSGVGFGGYAHDDTYKNIENIRGSKFNDVLIGDDQDNEINGEAGNDEIHGGKGNDIIIDLQGVNELYGDDGNDIIVSGLGNVCYGGLGIDIISYERLIYAVNIDMPSGITTIKEHPDLKDKFYEFENVVGTNANDVIIGDDQDNRIYDLGGDDQVYAGKGNDYIIASLGSDLYNGGEGIDTVSYEAEPDTALYLNLKTKKTTGATFALGDILESIEQIIGTKFNDVMIGDDEDNRFHGFDGDDEIYGGKGNDILGGGKGKNKLYGEDGDDVFNLSEGENLVYGGAGANTITYEHAAAGVNINLVDKIGNKSTAEVDRFEDIHDCSGSQYDDKIIGDSEMNKLNGLGGDDYIDGGKGGDTINGGEGNNILLGGLGNDKFILLEGSNQVDGGSDIDTAIYSNYMKNEYDLIFIYEELVKDMERAKNLGLKLLLHTDMNFQKPIIEKRKGVNIDLNSGIVLKPSGLQDNLKNVENIEGTHYDDVINGDDQANVLDGHNGDDEIHGGKGDDTIKSGRGHSKLYGEEGNDMFKVSYGTADIDGGEGNDSVNLVNQPTAVKINMQDGYITYNETQVHKFISIEAVSATEFADIIYDSVENNHIETNEGNDIVYLSDGDDFVDLGSGDDILYLNGSGSKQLLGGSGANKYVVMPGFISNNKTSVMVGDFKKSSGDIIDLTNIPSIRKVEDLKFEEMELEGYILTIIHISENKDIALLGIEMGKVDSECFIFHDMH